MLTNRQTNGRTELTKLMRTHLNTPPPWTAVGTENPASRKVLTDVSLSRFNNYGQSLIHIIFDNACLPSPILYRLRRGEICYRARPPTAAPLLGYVITITSV